MAFTRTARRANWKGYEIGDRVRFKGEDGEWHDGHIYGRGAAGIYLQIEDENGCLFEGQSGPDVEPVFSDEE